MFLCRLRNVLVVLVFLPALVLLSTLLALNQGSAHAVAPLPMQGQTADVYAPFDCSPGVNCTDVGDSLLVRTPAGVSMSLQTTGLDPGSVYTNWWVIYNFPEACIDGCDVEDLFFNEDVQATVVYATGHVIGPDGVGNFGANLLVGETSDDFPEGTFPGQENGLVNPMGARVELVIRTHGPPIPGRVGEQISQFSGGCDVNMCEDHQFSPHDPP